MDSLEGIQDVLISLLNCSELLNFLHRSSMLGHELQVQIFPKNVLKPSFQKIKKIHTTRPFFSNNKRKACCAVFYKCHQAQLRAAASSFAFFSARSLSRSSWSLSFLSRSSALFWICCTIQTLVSFAFFSGEGCCEDIPLTRPDIQPLATHF